MTNANINNSDNITWVERLKDQRFLFGRDNGEIYGEIKLIQDGASYVLNKTYIIPDYKSTNEWFWDVNDNNQLEFRSESGEWTSVFDLDEKQYNTGQQLVGKFRYDQSFKHVLIQSLNYINDFPNFAYAIQTDNNFTIISNNDTGRISSRTINKNSDLSTVNTGSTYFDSLYAMALDDLKLDSVEQINDASFNYGKPIKVSVFETGEKWTYVWTRDTAYSVLLGTPVVDPGRTARSLLFKLSEFKASADRPSNNTQVVQDTGTGGSYPVSTDRVVWALGAYNLLQYLDEDADNFREKCYNALKGTIEADRFLVFDEDDGLYRGETSFLDWREQTYPLWVTPTFIASSKALSTNILHFMALNITSRLALEQGDSALSAKYQKWATQLRNNIQATFYLKDEGLYGAFKGNEFDPSVVSRFDLLGTALAVMYVSPPTQGSLVVSQYPHVPRGAPVIYPQLPSVPIYHNRAMWPFVTALWIKASSQVKNWASVNHNSKTLLRSSGLHLSNMENMEFLSGQAWVDDGSLSGPVVNSRRQLWSVAGYLFLVQNIIFGMDANEQGIRFLPFLTTWIRDEMFVTQDFILWNNFIYKGFELQIRILLPDKKDGADLDGYYSVSSTTLNGNRVDPNLYIPTSKFIKNSSNKFVITLGEIINSNEDINLSDSLDLSDHMSPQNPTITSVTPVGGLLQLQINSNGEQNVLFNIYRDGELQAVNVDSVVWTDPNSADYDKITRCYAVESVRRNSKNKSQHSSGVCFWGTQKVRVLQATEMKHEGGDLVTNGGVSYIENWGLPSHTITISQFRPTYSGSHLLQFVYGNGAGPINTGAACGVKKLRIFAGNNPVPVKEAVVVFPQMNSWQAWSESTAISVDFDVTQNYTIILMEDETIFNMSYLQHFAAYTGAGEGGGLQFYNYVNIASLKILSIGK